jgi:hypothetical protein
MKQRKSEFSENERHLPERCREKSLRQISGIFFIMRFLRGTCCEWVTVFYEDILACVKAVKQAHRKHYVTVSSTKTKDKRYRKK